MSKLIRVTNPDGSFTFKDSGTGEIVNTRNSSLASWLSALGILYCLASVIVSIIFFANSSVHIDTTFLQVDKTNPLIVALGFEILFQGIVIILICLALSNLLDVIKELGI